MSSYIHRFVYYLSALFAKEKEREKAKPRRPEQSASRYFTPKRAPTRMDNRNGDFAIKRIYSYPEDLSKPAKISRSRIPLTRSSSQISLMKFGSEESIPFRMPESVRKLDSANRSQNGMSRPSDLKFGPGAIDMNTNHNPKIRDFSRLSANKGSKSSLDFSAAGEGLIRTSAKSSDCFVNEKMFPYTRDLHLRQNPFSHPGFPVKSSQANSKIPVRNPGRFTTQPKFNHRQRGQHTLPTNRFCNKNTLEDEDAGIRPPFVRNWIAYRMDTRKKFQCVFKFLSKQKHTTGNLIDAATHCQWMQLSGTMVDRDGKMFKQFAGCKVVLSFGEYKFLINEICSVHDLDYWDVLRKMATFQDQEIDDEDT